MSNPAENRKLWTTALRSGEFEQARGFLRKNDAFCCLGVACEIYRRETGKGGWDKNERFRTNRAMQKEVLPDPVRRWLGLLSPVGYFGVQSLAGMNDHGASFVEIADLVDDKPKGLAE